ncbi:hypothetical protein TD95_003842 [Thielaviopsis punctulata]|uniref:IMP-specific 5'-nucleotidase 1 n=1 Tax=Thielaviopsis punctulata TaxID=72032 RepID=A0A0F4Z777_9PEZI|nr:hypothetical protein TD95_003842 [Thielaviopsis punctulata]
MTTRYRVEYALKSHRRDQLIEWIKALLAVPFVLHSQPAGIVSSADGTVERMAAEAHRRYAEIMRDVEEMIDQDIAFSKEQNPLPSKLNLLVPSAGPFFTRLPLEAAFKYQDSIRYISSRRYVSPSFNDVRLILNSAQAMAVTDGFLQLATFDGDVTLYEDGQNLEPSSPIIPRLLDLLRRDIKIGIVTAAGYATAEGYYTRLHGLLDAVAASPDLTEAQKHALVIVGGEANYLFKMAPGKPHLLEPVPRYQWLTADMARWNEADITALLDVAQGALQDCVRSMNLPATLIRKDLAVGIIPSEPHIRLARESLEETVLVVQKTLELASMGLPPGRKIPFCAFNGGRDVFVDIGDKSWGVTVAQKFFRGTEGDMIRAANTLHVGDQFLSAGSNDFKARSVATTAWIASPNETVDLLAELSALLEYKK